MMNNSMAHCICIESYACFFLQRDVKVYRDNKCINCVTVSFAICVVLVDDPTIE